MLFFQFRNLKVERLGNKNTPKKFSPINENQLKILKEMGYDQMKGKNVKLIDPENTYKINTIMEKVIDHSPILENLQVSKLLLL